MKLVLEKDNKHDLDIIEQILREHFFAKFSLCAKNCEEYKCYMREDGNQDIYNNFNYFYLNKNFNAIYEYEKRGIKKPLPCIENRINHILEELNKNGYYTI